MRPAVTLEVVEIIEDEPERFTDKGRKIIILVSESTLRQ